MHLKSGPLQPQTPTTPGSTSKSPSQKNNTQVHLLAALAGAELPQADRRVRFEESGVVASWRLWYRAIQGCSRQGLGLRVGFRV